MAEKKIYTDQNLNGNEIKSVSLEKLTSDPTGFDGRIYLNTVSNTVRRYMSGVWDDVSQSVEPSPVIVLTSTDNLSTFTQSTPLIIEWDVEKYKDSGFTHSNSSNNSRIYIDNDGTYSIEGFLQVFSTTARTQSVPKILINGVVQDYPLASSYIRVSGIASNYWVLTFKFYPQKLFSGDYIEVQIEVDSRLTTASTPTLIGSKSVFWVTNLQGAKGEKGDAGSGSNITLKKNGATIGTITETLDILGNVPVIDEGSNKTSIEIGNYAHATGITQMPNSQIKRYTQLGGGTVDIDNYDLSTFNLHFIDPGTHDRDFTGMVAPPTGVNRIVVIINSSSSKKLKFKDNDASSTAANRILLADATDFDLNSAASVQFIYDQNASRWVTY